MIFYEIEMLSVPNIEFACSVEYERYKNRFHHLENFFEIGLCEEGRIVFRHADGSQEIIYPGMIMPTLSDLCCDTMAYHNDRQRHTTVGVMMDYRAIRHSSDEEYDLNELANRLRSHHTILIPYHEPIDDIFEDLLHCIKRIIAFHFSETPGGQSRALGEWYTLVAKLTDFVYTKLSKESETISPSEWLYAAHAEQYIAEHYGERLSVKAIATHLGISEGYLHRIFNHTKGMGVLEYVNGYRIFVALELIRTKRLTLSEAALNVGIDDPSYMSRLFKKTTGMCYRDYIRHKSKAIPICNKSKECQ